jgi:predicted transcriptional regulator
MEVLWDRCDAMTVREVLDILDERGLAYTTVMTVMNNLYEKQMLVRSKIGRAWLYKAALSRGEYTGQVMRDALLSTSDQSSALAHFVEAMSDEESAALRDLLRRRARRRR